MRVHSHQRTLGKPHWDLSVTEGPQMSIGKWIAKGVARTGMLPVLGRTSKIPDLPQEWVSEASPGFLYRGLRYQNQAEVTPEGHLILRPGRNFGNIDGISFAEDPNIAIEYATRTGGPVWGPTRQDAGAVVRIPYDEIADRFRLSDEAMGEKALYRSSPIMIGRGGWDVGYFDTPFNQSIKNLATRGQYYEDMPIDELVEQQALAYMLNANREYAETFLPRPSIIPDYPEGNLLGTQMWVSNRPSELGLESALQIEALQKKNAGLSFEEFLERMRSGLYDRSEEFVDLFEENVNELPFWSYLGRSLGQRPVVNPLYVPY